VRLLFAQPSGRREFLGGGGVRTNSLSIKGVGPSVSEGRSLKAGGAEGGRESNFGLGPFRRVRR